MKTHLLKLLLVSLSVPALFVGCQSLMRRPPNEIQKPVMLIGAGLTPTLEEREDQVGRAVLARAGDYRSCYEKVLAAGNLPNSEGIFYFTVDKAGTLGDIASETLADDAGKEQYGVLRACMTEALKKVKVAPFGEGKLTFRYRVAFAQ